MPVVWEIAIVNFQPIYGCQSSQANPMESFPPAAQGWAVPISTAPFTVFPIFPMACIWTAWSSDESTLRSNLLPLVQLAILSLFKVPVALIAFLNISSGSLATQGAVNSNAAICSFISSSLLVIGSHPGHSGGAVVSGVVGTHADSRAIRLSSLVQSSSTWSHGASRGVVGVGGGYILPCAIIPPIKKGQEAFYPCPFTLLSSRGVPRCQA